MPTIVAGPEAVQHGQVTAGSQPVNHAPIKLPAKSGCAEQVSRAIPYHAGIDFRSVSAAEAMQDTYFGRGSHLVYRPQVRSAAAKSSSVQVPALVADYARHRIRPVRSIEAEAVQQSKLTTRLQLEHHAGVAPASGAGGPVQSSVGVLRQHPIRLRALRLIRKSEKHIFGAGLSLRRHTKSRRAHKSDSPSKLLPCHRNLQLPNRHRNQEPRLIGNNISAKLSAE